MKSSFIKLILIVFISNGFCQDADFNPEVKKYFLIVASTTDYSEAFTIANSISEQLNLKLDLRELKQSYENLGLTWSKSECEGNNWDFPCYVARGRYDDGNFVSIEWSSAYSGFSKGYYVVMISSSGSYDKTLKDILIKARGYVPTAYVKSSMVYMGCLH